MKTNEFLEGLQHIGIDTFIGVPDSTLSTLCAKLNEMDNQHHMCTVNEGAAVALAAGHFVATNQAACVYMQNSGLGNAVNPIASLTHQDVYDIPMLFLVGYRGKPGEKDEPQHVYQGKITFPLLDVLGIEHAELSKQTTSEEFQDIMKDCNIAISQHKSYAIVIDKGSFEKDDEKAYENSYMYVREDAIQAIAKHVDEKDVLVSTTGKISRELYEQLDAVKGNHQQAFLTVGSMGHASMIGFGMAQALSNKKVYCIDGDGANLMHLGSLAFIAQQCPNNFIHIVLNNGAHESVGGMPTGASEVRISNIAKSCGYAYTITVDNEVDFQKALQSIDQHPKPCMIEVLCKMQSRDDLGRPKESPIQNKTQFMKHNEVTK